MCMYTTLLMHINTDMKILLSLALLSITAALSAQPGKLPEPGKPVRAFETGNPMMYHKGWVDFNKNGKKDIYEDPEARIDDRIEDLLSQMTVDEKTCQMVTLYGYRRVLQDDLPNEKWKTSLWKDGIGAIDEHLNSFRNWGLPLTTDNPNIWPASRHAWALNEVQRFFVEETRLGIPVDFTNEGIRGIESYKATNFPTQLGIGHTWNRELVRRIGNITGSEARLLGYTNVYAPILDVGRDQRWGRYEEVYGESPYLVAELGIEMVKGLQQDYQVAATAKHYAAYANNKGGREGMSRVDPQMPPREVENIHMYPWKRVIGEAGLLGAMSSYNDYDGVPVQGSSYWLDEKLRKEYGFRGYVVSDSDAVEYLHTKHRTSPDMKESVRQSVMAGLNVRCTFRSPDGYVLPLRELIAEGTVPMSVVDDRVRDVLRVKFLTGLFDQPYQLDLRKADEVVDGILNNQTALQASRESIVLLKNDGGVLPLDISKLKTVAVVGPNADETGYASTHYGPLATDNVSVLQGLRKALEGKSEVLYAKGCEMVDANWPDSELFGAEMLPEDIRMMEEAVAVATKADVIVAVMGGGQRTCGENKSRSSLELPGHQNQLLKELKKTGKPVILVLINGRPLSINWAAANIDAIVEAWYPGAHGGTAVADVLTGAYNPGGKLTVTFPKSVGQIPFNFPFKPNSQVDGAQKVGPDGKQSRVHGALYYFGYGLSYTTFEYADLKLSRKYITPDESVDVSFTVKNTGDVKGDEVVQLYVHDRISSVTVYERQLRGFERVSLEPGETKTVTMTLNPDDLSLLDLNMDRVVEPGEFDILVAASSVDIRLADVLTVLKEGETVKSGVESNEPKPLLPVTIGVNEDVTLPVDDSNTISNLTIEWNMGTDCDFEILITNGGGQFIPVYSGKAKGPQTQVCKFERVGAVEVRVLVTRGKGSICSLRSPSLR